MSKTINKVIYGDEVILDLSQDDVTTADVQQNKKFHLSSGAPATGSVTFPSGSKSITTNGDHDVEFYKTANVNVQPNLGTKTITTNNTYTATNDSLQGYSSVTVNVPSNVAAKSAPITQNGTYNALTTDNVDGYSEVTVSVPMPSGTINITNTNLTDVSSYANAQVVDANLVSSNIIQGATILGVQGSVDVGVNPAGLTATANDVLAGKTFYAGNKTQKTGNIQTYSGTTSVTTNTATLQTAGKYVENDITVNVPATILESKTGLIEVTPGKNGATGTLTTADPSNIQTSSSLSFTTNSSTHVSTASCYIEEDKEIGYNGLSDLDLQIKINPISSTTFNITRTLAPGETYTSTLDPTLESSPADYYSGGNISITAENNFEDISTSATLTNKLTAANVGKAYRFTGTTDSSYVNGNIYVVVEETI